ncbi:MAG: GNAT family N-acetyltransferase [Ruminiclostridium sp.]|nr:GNAT family N-acetyltransferase [Ruminiclostridium sp.]
MEIRRAAISDIDGINRLLRQVLEVHHEGRPDLFKGGVKKYTNTELAEIIRDDGRPIFAAFDGERLVGYAFCVIKYYPHDNILTDIKTLYIDDLCVDETERGKHIGTAVYEYVKEYAKNTGCYNITLNVWECNPPAKRFYEHLGLVPQKIGMEMILK